MRTPTTPTNTVDVWIARVAIRNAARELRRYATGIQPVATDLAKRMRKEANRISRLLGDLALLEKAVPECPCPYDMLTEGK